MTTVHDPLEGITADGYIVTGAARERVPPAYQPILEAAIDWVAGAADAASLYLYGSVATGMARVPNSDVDLVSIGLSPDQASELAQRLWDRFAALCRSVAVGTGQPEDQLGDTWEAYGNRVFLRHYCVHLAGPDRRTGPQRFHADAAAARGFNGDIAALAARWRAELLDGADPAALSRRVGRKSLFAVTGLVSVHDATWTTDREAAATRWAELHPELSPGLAMLARWGLNQDAPEATTLAGVLDESVARIVEAFEAAIGLW